MNLIYENFLCRPVHWQTHILTPCLKPDYCWQPASLRDGEQNFFKVPARSFLPTTDEILMPRDSPPIMQEAFCQPLFAGFLVLSCLKRALVWGNYCERLCVETFVRVLHSSEVISLILCK